MRVFVTGATGWIGSAIVKDLLSARHQVLGLSRSDHGSRALAECGAESHRGSLEDLNTLRNGAAQCDAVIHTAFDADFSRIAVNAAIEKHAIESIGSVLVGSIRPFIVTSGVAMLAPGRVATEADEIGPVLDAFPRASEQTAVALAKRGVRAAVVRLPPIVHGRGEQHGFVPIFIRLARQKGVSAYVGDGLNRWPAVHRLDAARVFRLALEQGADDSPLHAVAEGGISFKQIAETIGRRLNVPVVSISPLEAAEHFGGLARFSGGDFPASSEKTKARLGWQAQQAGLLVDIDHKDYFVA